MHGYMITILNSLNSHGLVVAMGIKYSTFHFFGNSQVGDPGFQGARENDIFKTT